MKNLIGCDIVYLPAFAQSIQEGGELFLSKIFTQNELNTAQTLESRAGFFAIKESVIKALGHKIPWLDIVVYKQETGKPALHLPISYAFYTCDVSVAHHGDYAIAVAIISQQG